MSEDPDHNTALSGSTSTGPNSPLSSIRSKLSRFFGVNVREQKRDFSKEQSEADFGQAMPSSPYKQNEDGRTAFSLNNGATAQEIFSANLPLQEWDPSSAGSVVEPLAVAESIPTHSAEDVLTYEPVSSSHDWASVSVEVLTRGLSNHRNGSRIKRAIQYKRCYTIADVLAIADSEWLQVYAFGVGCLATLHQELDKILSETESASSLQKSSDQENSEIQQKEANELAVMSGNWRNMSVSVLMERLTLRGGAGTRAIRAIYELGLESLGDVVAVNDNRWLQVRAFGWNSLAVLKEELRNLLETIDGAPAFLNGPAPTGLASTQARLRVQKRYFPTKQQAISATSGSLQTTEPVSVRKVLFGTDSWSKLQARVRLDPQQLKAIPIQRFLNRLDDGKSFGVIKRAIQAKKCTTFFDLVEVRTEEWLDVPQFGPRTLEALTDEVAALLALVEIEVPFKPEFVSVTDSTDDSPAACQGSEPVQGALALPAASAPIQSWQDISDRIPRLLDDRQLEIARRYYGFYGKPETLTEIGQHFKLTRERVRQLKSKAFRSVSKEISPTVAASILRNKAGKIAPAVRRAATTSAQVTQLVAAGAIPESDLWIVRWFEDAWGPDWSTSTDWNDLFSSQSFAPTGAPANTVDSVVDYVFLHSYCPVTVDSALALAHKSDPSLTPHQLLEQLENVAGIRIFTCGQTQIGHVTWRWFNPEWSRKTRLVEWAMRLTHRMVSPDELAQVIATQLGELGITTFDVAEACEENATLFFGAGGRYGLALWQDTHQHRNAISQLLDGEPLTVPELESAWRKQSGEWPTTETLVAALYCHPEQFQMVDPLRWASTETAIIEVDPQSFTFEDFLPDL